METRPGSFAYRRPGTLVTVVVKAVPPTFVGSGPDCDPSYSGVCIPPYPPDLDCDDVPYNNIVVVGSDPHSFDGYDNDGRGCES